MMIYLETRLRFVSSFAPRKQRIFRGAKGDTTKSTDSMKAAAVIVQCDSCKTFVMPMRGDVCPSYRQ